MFKFLRLFKAGVANNTEVTKPLTQKIYKSFLVLYTAPFARGSKIAVEKYQGVVQGMDLWYLKLKAQNRCIFIPTSYVYDKTVEVFE